MCVVWGHAENGSAPRFALVDGRGANGIWVDYFPNGFFSHFRDKCPGLLAEVLVAPDVEGG